MHQVIIQLKVSTLDFCVVRFLGPLGPNEIELVILDDHVS
jgi:hypothetical protein